MKDGKFNHAVFYTAEEGLEEYTAKICKACCTRAVAAWAIKAKLERAEPPPTPTPTGPPTATGESPLEAEARARRIAA
jgi:hypothetical protein